MSAAGVFLAVTLCDAALFGPPVCREFVYVTPVALDVCEARAERALRREIAGALGRFGFAICTEGQVS